MEDTRPVLLPKIILKIDNGGFGTFVRPSTIKVNKLYEEKTNESE